MRLISSSFFFLLLIPIFFIYLLQHNSNGPWKRPFWPSDLLPLLPSYLSLPLLRSLHSAVDLLPTYVGVVSSPEAKLQWRGACFYNNSAWMEFHNKSKSPYGGGTLHIKISDAHSWTCMDLYVFATPYRVTWDYYFISREHTIEFYEWEGEREFEYAKRYGVSAFLMQSGILGTLRALWHVFPLFTNTGWGDNSNLAFLEKHIGAKFEERPKPWTSSINVDDIHTGDFLEISKIRGRWGGFETLEKWVTGAYAGHTAVFLKDPKGKLWVAESGNENDKNCSNPNVLDCPLCTHDYLFGSFFDAHKSVSDHEFRNFLIHEIPSVDLCGRLIDSTKTSEISHHRRLHGEGAHRRLVTTVIFYKHPEFARVVTNHSCEAIAIEYLPAGVFADPFELQHLVRRKVFIKASVYGDTNIELPAAHSNGSVVEIHIDVKKEAYEIVIQLPLHSRYQPLDSKGYKTITLSGLDLFMRCRLKKETESEESCCLWDMAVPSQSVSNETAWRVPCGNESHATAVTYATFASAIFFSLLIVFFSTYFSMSSKFIFE